MRSAHMFAAGIEAVIHGGMQAACVAAITCFNTRLHIFKLRGAAIHRGMVHLSFSKKYRQEITHRVSLSGEWR